MCTYLFSPSCKEIMFGNCDLFCVQLNNSVHLLLICCVKNICLSVSVSLCLLPDHPSVSLSSAVVQFMLYHARCVHVCCKHTQSHSHMYACTCACTLHLQLSLNCPLWQGSTSVVSWNWEKCSFQTGFSLFNAAVVCAILESISGLEPSSVIT